MVGVPGRSKGCATCRKRKVACTLEKPVCYTCIKSKRECGGYERKRIFVLDHWTQQASESTTELGSRSKSSSEEIEEVRSDLVAMIPAKTAFVAPSSIYSPSTRAVYRQQILAEVIHKGHSSSWLSMLHGSNFHPPLEATGLAVCTAKLGHVNEDKLMVHESLKFYIQGLRELQRALRDPKMAYKEETLAACMLLITYEVTECPNHNLTGMMAHAKGCAQLFKARGPDAYSSQFGHELFISFRHLEILQALAERRSTFLSNPEWTDVPWRGYVKQDRDYLHDLMADMSALTELGYKQLTVPSPTPPEDIQNLVDQGWILESKLTSFWETLESHTIGLLYWSALASGSRGPVANDPEFDNVFPAAFQFSSVSIAYICMSYWAMQCILWASLVYLYEHPPFLDSDDDLSPKEPSEDSEIISLAQRLEKIYERPLGHRTNVTQPAKYICQSMEYCFENNTSFAGVASAVFPLKVAIEILNEDPTCARELAWAQAVMEKISHGIQVIRHTGYPLTSHGYIPG